MKNVLKSSFPFTKLSKYVNMTNSTRTYVSGIFGRDKL